MDLSKLKLKDEAFTKKEFSLTTDKNGVLQTIPKPKNLSSYYNFGGYISHQSEQKDIIHSIYNWVKLQMFRTKLGLLEKHLSELNSVLDFGCGTGEFISYLKSNGINSEGVEPTLVAYQKAMEKNIEVYKDINESKKTYDAITLFHVLEHVDDYEKTIQDLSSKLNSKGLMLIAVPNYKSHDAEYYKEKWAAWDVPRHLWHFNRKNIKDIAGRFNLELVKIRPMPFDAFYISMVSESYKGNSKVKGLWRGLISNLEAIHTKEYSSNLFLLQKGL
ncbi:class I SAM-dependent methyltransferase [Psychroflexus sp. CAK1W]|uniref:class I SAM-dependent methyltransferase n=1 Tax=Psychroflexus curvus TaxID=2873595 RepID=UPI001CCD6B82|nr:class I SAM-dependent methyltransferase [Psychroflexus curvus]MBZ9626925.1 class I SAM-dependent methyltransferase [Psychroflexus curvus]